MRWILNKEKVLFEIKKWVFKRYFCELWNLYRKGPKKVLHGQIKSIVHADYFKVTNCEQCLFRVRENYNFYLVPKYDISMQSNANVSCKLFVVDLLDNYTYTSLHIQQHWNKVDYILFYIRDICYLSNSYNDIDQKEVIYLYEEVQPFHRDMWNKSQQQYYQMMRRF